MDKQVVDLRVGMLGWSAEAIAEGKGGYCYFPVGEKDETYEGGRVWIKLRVTAAEDIREERDVIVADPELNVKEHTPVELSYERTEGGFQRVTETYPLPVTEAQEYDDYVAIAFTASQQKYVIGTQAQAAVATRPLFEARRLLLFATANCLVRYNGATRVQHLIPANTYLTVDLRVTELYVVRQAVNGTLRVWSFGGGL